MKLEDHLKKGQEVLVQITKEPIGTKGPRVTSARTSPTARSTTSAWDGIRTRIDSLTMVAIL